MSTPASASATGVLTALDRANAMGAMYIESMCKRDLSDDTLEVLADALLEAGLDGAAKYIATAISRNWQLAGLYTREDKAAWHEFLMSVPDSLIDALYPPHIQVTQ